MAENDKAAADLLALVITIAFFAGALIFLLNLCDARRHELEKSWDSEKIVRRQ